MVARNPLLTAPPYEVETSLKTLGANLRTARLRRNLSLEQVAQKVGVGRQVISAAEKGKPSTGIATYAAILWVLGLVDQLTRVADPDHDEQGKALAKSRERERASTSKDLSDDF